MTPDSFPSTHLPRIEAVPTLEQGRPVYRAPSVFKNIVEAGQQGSDLARYVLKTLSERRDMLEPAERHRLLKVDGLSPRVADLPREAEAGVVNQSIAAQNLVRQMLEGVISELRDDSSIGIINPDGDSWPDLEARLLLLIKHRSLVGPDGLPISREIRLTVKRIHGMREMELLRQHTLHALRKRYDGARNALASLLRRI